MNKPFSGAADPMQFINDQVGACGPGEPYGTGADEDAMVERLRRQSLMCAAPSNILPFVASGGTANPILAAGTGAFAATPVAPCRVQRLTIAASIAPFFVMTSLKSGRCDAFENAGDMPLDIFTGDNQTACIALDVIVPGTPLVITVRNIDAVSHSFFAGALALEVKGPWGGLCNA